MFSKIGERVAVLVLPHPMVEVPNSNDPLNPSVTGHSQSYEPITEGRRLKFLSHLCACVCVSVCVVPC